MTDLSMCFIVLRKILVMPKFFNVLSLITEIPKYFSSLPIIKKVQPCFWQLKPFLGANRGPLKLFNAQNFWRSVLINQRRLGAGAPHAGAHAALRGRNKDLLVVGGVPAPQEVLYGDATGGQARKQFGKNWGVGLRCRELFGGRGGGYGPGGHLLRKPNIREKMMSFPPVKPDPGDCCGQGCNPCILDVYEEQLRKYNTSCCSQPKTATVNCLLPTSFSVFKLTHMNKDTEDTNLYTFKFVKRCVDSNDRTNEPQDCRLCFRPGQFFILRGVAKDPNGKYVSRPYTVVHNYKDYDYSFDALIKIWIKGNLTKNYVSYLQPGDLTFWRGPYGKFKINYNLKNVLMIAQGTGITPMYDIANAVVRNDSCETTMKLFFSCKDSKNIHMRYQLNELSENWNFTYVVFLGEEKGDFAKLHRENIVKSLLKFDHFKEYFEKIDPNDNFQVLLAGDPSFSKSVLEYLSKLGVKKDIVHQF